MQEHAASGPDSALCWDRYKRQGGASIAANSVATWSSLQANDFRGQDIHVWHVQERFSMATSGGDGLAGCPSSCHVRSLILSPQHRDMHVFRPRLEAVS